MTNWMGVKMLFYPIEYMGADMKRWKDTPYGFFGWQGVVPCKTERMAGRLVNIVTRRLLSLQEAFGRLDAAVLAQLLLPAVEECIRRDCGDYWFYTLRPILPRLLQHLLSHLQLEIDDCLDLHHIVLSAFLRDKELLVDLFQKVGRVELEFLINSGFGFGLVLGLFQALAWARYPLNWTLPVAGALVGYVTNWIAIKLLFEPAEPVQIVGTFEIQGLFEARQIEVSDEFGTFMEKRVLNSPSLLQDLSKSGGGAQSEDTADDVEGVLYDFLRRHLPYPIPSHILHAAVSAVRQVAHHPQDYPHLHEYVTQQLDIEATLSSRLKKLSPKEFEDLLHPVFQEDEITLIATGGVLGFLAGMAQTRLGWGGPNATSRALGTIAVTLAASFGFYGLGKYEEQHDPPLASVERPHLRRRATVVRIVGEV